MGKNSKKVLYTSEYLEVVYFKWNEYCIWGSDFKLFSVFSVHFPNFIWQNVTNMLKNGTKFHKRIDKSRNKLTDLTKSFVQA